MVNRPSPPSFLPRIVCSAWVDVDRSSFAPLGAKVFTASDKCGLAVIRVLLRRRRNRTNRGGVEAFWNLANDGQFPNFASERR